MNADVHPLAEARAQQESSDLKSKLSQIIYQGIVDRLKLGPVHADDLEPLFPPEVRGICRRLVGAQFGSLASRGYIREKERRKSSVRSRRSAKSGVFEFTKKGRETLVGVGGEKGETGVVGTASSRGSLHSGEDTQLGDPEGTLGRIPGTLDRPAQQLSTRADGAGSHVRSEPGDGSPGDSLPAPGEPPRLFGDDPPSAFNPWKDAA